VVDNRLQPLAVIRVEVNRDGYRQLRRFASRWSHAVWAVEGATGLGATLTARLTADRIDVIDVPAKLARRVQMLSTGHGRKTDQADACPSGSPRTPPPASTPPPSTRAVEFLAYSDRRLATGSDCTCATSPSRSGKVPPWRPSFSADRSPCG
jgi:hypothetical protein